MYRFLFRHFIFMSMLVLVACNGGQSSNDKGVVVIDFYKIIERSPEISKLNDETLLNKYTQNMEALLKDQSSMLEAMNKELSGIKDTQSLEARDKRQKLLYNLEQHQKKIIDLSMTRVIAKMKAYDVAFKQMESVSLEVAKSLGARVVLPIQPLPSPNPKIEYPKQVLKDPQMEGPRIWQRYVDAVFTRKVFSHDPRVDITNRVLDELKKRYQWK